MVSCHIKRVKCLYYMYWHQTIEIYCCSVFTNFYYIDHVMPLTKQISWFSMFCSQLSSSILILKGCYKLEWSDRWLHCSLKKNRMHLWSNNWSIWWLRGSWEIISFQGEGSTTLEGVATLKEPWSNLPRNELMKRHSWQL